MTMLLLIRLYLDYFKRFESKQIFPLLRNKTLKKLFFQDIGSYTKKSKFEDKTTYHEFRQRLCALLIAPDGSLLFNKNKSEKLLKNRYFKSVRKSFGCIQKNDDINADLWKMEDEDFETQNNYFRFHLFNQIAEELNKSPDFGKELILKWIEFDLNTNKLASNSFNCTLRIFNWLKILISLPDSETMTEDEWSAIRDSVVIQNLYIRDNIESHIPGNHIFIQYYILWLVSNLFNSFCEDPEYSTEIENKIEKEIRKEFLSDGLHFELSYHYHIQITQFVLMWMIGMKNLGKPVAKDITERVVKAVNLVEQFMLPDGSLPMIGDNCYTFIHSSLTEDIKNIMRLKSMLFTDESNLEDRKNVYNIDNEYVISNTLSTKLIVDVGNLGYSSNPGHGHSDMLSFIYFDKVPIFIDPGTRRYGNTIENLSYKRARMHNTITVDGKDHGYLWGFFRWSFLPKSKHPQIDCYNNKIVIEGESDFSQIIKNVLHRRKFIHSERELIIEDRIIGSLKHDVEFNFILSPSIKPSLTKSSVVLETNKFSWLMAISSKVLPDIQIIPIDVYPSYSLSVRSSKIIISFKKADLPLVLQVKIMRFDT